MTSDQLLPDLGDLRALSPTTVRLARGLLLVVVLIVGSAFLVVADTPGGRVVVAAVTVISLGVAVTLTWRRGGGGVVADLPVVRTALAVVLLLAVAATLLLDVGPPASAGVLLLGVLAVTAAFVLAAPFRQLVGAGAVVVWLAVLWLDGVRDLVILSTHGAGAVLLMLAAWRTAVIAERALTDELDAAADAGQRTVLTAAVLRMQSLHPGAVEQALREGASQLGFRGVIVHPVTASGVIADQGGSDADLAAQVAAARTAHTRRDRGGRRVLGLPLMAGRELLAVLTAHASRATGSHDTSDRDGALALLVEEGAVALARARRYADDAATVGELRRLERQTQDFVSTVSHELRTPVTVIAGLGQALARRWDDLSADKRADLLHRIDANAERLAGMVRSLMDSSAFERGELSVQREPTPVAELLDDVAARLTSVTAPRTVRVEAPPGVSIDVDPSLLRHALENLLGNAARHTPPETSIEIVARLRAGEVELLVRDDGPGIASEDLPHVLERFYRGAPAPVARPGGLGLGLALVEQIVSLHGSELAVRNRPRGGVVFSFSLPVAVPPGPDVTSS